MRFIPQAIEGVYLVTPQPHSDVRGAFARLYCEQEFHSAGLDFKPVQVNLSSNVNAYTLRGLHIQRPPFDEEKFVHVVSGSAYDVIVDLRSNSPTYRSWLGVVLGGPLWQGVFIPKGCAHGFLTLQDKTDVLYHMGQPFKAGADGGVRWNDPAFQISWPAQPRIMSERDANYPDFEDNVS